jgi:hypothetical protein
MFKKAIQRGRSEVHEAPNKARHVCGRPRDGERAVSSEGRTIITRPPQVFYPCGTLRL